MQGLWILQFRVIQEIPCVRETEILVETQTPLGVFFCDHAGLVINKSSLGRPLCAKGYGRLPGGASPSTGVPRS